METYQTVKVKMFIKEDLNEFSQPKMGESCLKSFWHIWLIFFSFFSLLFSLLLPTVAEHTHMKTRHR